MGCGFYGCACMAIRGSFVFDLSKQVGLYVVSVLTMRERRKTRWSSPLLAWFDGVVFARAVVDSYCLVETPRRWLREHTPFVLDCALKSSVLLILCLLLCVRPLHMQCG